MRHKFTFLLTTLLLFSLLIAPVGTAGALAPNLIQDPSLEAAIASTAIWQQASTNSDTPLCIPSDNDCAFPGISAPRTGSVWAVFGGIDWGDEESISPEVGDLYQNVTFPSCGASLQFYFWIGAAPAGSNTADVFNVKIDNVTVFSANATQKSSYPSYTLVNVDVSAYANSGVHKVEFHSVTDGQMVTFNVDDISLTQTCVTISGNAGVAGATLNYTGGGSATADGSGNYSFNVPYEWSGTVTPSKSGYIFAPVSRTYSNVTTNQTGQNYTATAIYSISGNVGVAGVTLSYTDGTPKTATSVSNGDYSFTIPSNWSGTVTPSHPCFTFSPTNRSYSNVTTNQTSQNYTPTPIPSSGCADIDVLIGGTNQGNFAIESQGTLIQAPFAGINNGPVQIASTVSLIGSERVIYKVNGVPTSFSEMMGLPDSQLASTYWLPWYNNVDLDTQLRFGNVSNSTATVHVSIGGVEMLGSPFTLGVGESTRVSFAGINNGPVEIVSDVDIVAAERVIYKVNGINTSFTEMMGLPASQLDNIYWLPWYNNVDLDTQLRFGNVSNSTSTVHVSIGGVEMAGSPFTLGVGESTRVSFAGINNGPVEIVSDVDIVAAERVIYKVNGINTSFSEMMGLPDSQLDSTYWLLRYNNVDLDTQLRFGNVSGSTATVHVFIGGSEMTGSPFTLEPGESTRVSFPGVNTGLVQIVSDVNIVAAERVIYKVNNVSTSFSEMMALPNSQLDTSYWLPWYNNVDLDTQLRFGVP